MDSPRPQVNLKQRMPRSFDTKKSTCFNQCIFWFNSCVQKQIQFLIKKHRPLEMGSASNAIGATRVVLLAFLHCLTSSSVFPSPEAFKSIYDSTANTEPKFASSIKAGLWWIMTLLPQQGRYCVQPSDFAFRSKTIALEILFEAARKLTSENSHLK